MVSVSESVVASFSRQGIRVVFDSSPSADLENRVLHLPPLPFDLDEETMTLFRGHLDHELGHFLFTDPCIVKKVYRFPCLFSIFNSIEDAFVEREMSSRWIGCEKNLEKSLDIILKQRKDRKVTQHTKALCALFLISKGWSISEALTATRASALWIEDVKHLVPCLCSVSSSKDSLRLARKIDAIWSSKGRHPDQSPGDNIAELRKNKAITQIRGHRILKNSRNRSSSLFVSRRAEYVDLDENADSRQEHSPGYRRRRRRATTNSDLDAWYKAVGEVCPALKRRLMNKFLGRKPRVVRNRAKGRLDDKSLFKVPFNPSRVFRSRSKKVDVNASVCLLVDLSGSMSTVVKAGVCRRDLALLASAALSETLDSMSIPVCCLGFTTDSTSRAYHCKIKSASKTYRESRENFFKASKIQGLENLDGKSLNWAAKELASFTDDDSNPVLIVLSDGYPACMGHAKADLHKHLKTVVTRLVKANVSLLSVGIASKAVKAFYPDYTVVEDLKELPKAMYDLIEKTFQRSA